VTQEVGITRGGLIYVSNAPVEPTFELFMLRLGLARDPEYTTTARALEPHWKPDVFKRIPLTGLGRT